LASSFEFEIGDTKFRAAKMSAWTQADVLKRMLPLFCSFISLRSKLPALLVPAGADGEEVEKGAESQSFDVLFSSIAMQIAKLDDKDSDFVYDACLNLVSWNKGSTWTKIYVGNKRFIDDTLSGARMLAIVTAVLKNEFVDFFSEAQKDLFGALLR
jgi:hypothetical protein